MKPYFLQAGSGFLVFEGITLNMPSIDHFDMLNAFDKLCSDSSFLLLPSGKWEQRAQIVKYVRAKCGRLSCTDVNLEVSQLFV